MTKHCPQLKKQLQELKSLFSQYCLELEKVKNSKEYESIFNIQKEIGDGIKQIQEVIIVSLEKAREIMGDSFYGPEEVANTFGFEIKKEGMPEIPYSQKELVKAKELGESLILRISHDPEGNPMTLQIIDEIMTPRLDKDDKGRLFFVVGDWYKDEYFYTNDPLKLEWRLVGGSFVPDIDSEKDESGKYTEDSTDKNYIQQTRLLRNYLKSINSLTSEEEAQCSDDILMSLVEKIGVDWATGEVTDRTTYEANCKKVALELSQLSINLNYRRSPAEIIYDFSVQFNKSKSRGFLEDNREWSRTLSSRGELVHVGLLNDSGAGVSARLPDDHDDSIGVVSVR